MSFLKGHKISRNTAFKSYNLAEQMLVSFSSLPKNSPPNHWILYLDSNFFKFRKLPTLVQRTTDLCDLNFHRTQPWDV